MIKHFQRIIFILLFLPIFSFAQEDVSQLIEQSRSGSSQSRCAALIKLGEMGPAAKEAVPALLKLILDEDFKVRARASLTLGTISSDKKVILALIGSLQDPHPAVRNFTMGAFNRFGEKGNDASPYIANALFDKEEYVRRSAASVISKIGPPHKESLNVLIKALKDKESGIRQGVAEAIGLMGESALPAAPALAELFNDKYTSVQERAIKAIRKMGPKATAFLIQAVEHPTLDQEYRNLAMDGLGDIGLAAADDAVPVLSKILSADPGGGQRVTDALKRMGPKAAREFLHLSQDRNLREHNITSLSEMGRVAVPILFEALDDKNYKDRTVAAETLARMKVLGASDIKPLVKNLSDKDPSVRRYIVDAIGNMRELAAPASKPLLTLLEKEVDYSVLPSLSTALTKIGEVSIPGLCEMLKIRNAMNPCMITSILGGMREKAASAVPSLIRLLSDSDIQLCAIYALGSIGPAAADAVPSLTTFWDKGGIQERYATISALGNIGVRSPAVNSVLHKALEDPNPGMKMTGVVALSRFGALDSATISALLLLLDNDEPRMMDSPSMKESALKIVEKAHPSDAKILAKLEILLNDKDYSVRIATIRALGAIGQTEPKAIHQIISAMPHFDHTFLQREALTALDRLDSVPAEVVATLTFWLRDADLMVQDKSAELLGKIGAPAASAIPKLMECACPHAAEAIKAITSAKSRGQTD